jgi:hypothetical protein
MSRIDELERRIAELEKHLRFDEIRPQPAMPYAPLRNPFDAGSFRAACPCPPNTVCGSTACPRLINPMAAGH